MPSTHRRTDEQILHDATAHCREKGLRLTAGRRRVLEVLACRGDAVKAYDVLDAVTEPGRKAMPPVVYRALDFWIEQGFVHKIESLNAYFSCGHPLHNHGCQLLVCSHCGKTVEVCDGDLREQLAETARRNGFEYGRVVLEIHGACPACCS
ncbi:MAG: transcriptional repressor [Lentisphaerae bacterium]|nr:transcriptional repressor [Lentisphaerota bacterium]MBT5606158.1 transcriptional repressor [Lentisphaerota bacterium]MBT7056377.1 transcriptional repressor [Lentisphaerota bacterium]MBT7842947.1 transcriptional repressor [Lentisphaerota bacterium]